MLGPAERAGGVDLHDSLPAGERLPGDLGAYGAIGILHRIARVSARHAGNVRKHVKSAVLRCYFAEHCDPRVLVGNIEPAELGGAAAGSDFIHHLVSEVFVDLAVHNQRSSGCGELTRGFGTNPGARAGDKGDFVL